MNKVKLRLLYLPVIIAAFLFVPACGGDDATPPTFKTTLTVKNFSGDEAGDFSSGDQITLALSITNLTDSPQEIILTTSQLYDFKVLKKSASGTLSLVWWWANGRGFLSATTPMNFAAKETKEFVEIWDQVGDSSSLVGPGDYAAQGWIATNEEFSSKSLEPTELRSPMKSFTIH